MFNSNIRTNYYQKRHDCQFVARLRLYGAVRINRWEYVPLQKCNQNGGIKRKNAT